MKVVVKTNNLSREEWLKYRTKGIGGSDVSIIAGINPFKSAHQLWLEKTGQIEPEKTDSEYAHFGTLLEPIVRREFTQRTGIRVRQKHMLLQSEEYPFMFADLDGVINEDGEMAVFEAKTASAYKQEVWEKGIPAPYILQVQHYGSDIIGLNQKEPNSKGDAEFSPVLILSLGGIECKERKMPIWNRASQIRKLN